MFRSSKRVHRLTDSRQRRNADVLDKTCLRRGRAALHAIDHDYIGAGMNGKLHVVEGARCADLHIDRLFPIRDLAQLLDLDREVVGTGPVGMTACRTLVDTRGERAHGGHTRVDLLPEQHAAAARLRTLPDDYFYCIGAAHVVGIPAIARRQALIHQRLG
jgi:hypothetical protein